MLDNVVPSLADRVAATRRKGSLWRPGHCATVVVEYVEEEEETEHLKPVVCAVGDWRKNWLDGAEGVGKRDGSERIEERDGTNDGHGTPECASHKVSLR